MIRALSRSLAAAAVVCAVTFISAPASAQDSTEPAWQEWNYQMMRDLTQAMRSMTEQMSRGDLTPEQRLQMARRMERMSMMMRRMSGLATRPTIIGPEWQKQMRRMRQEMDEMLQNPRMTPHG